MIVPIANAIFDGEIDIEDYYKPKTNGKNDIENIYFRRVNKIFPIIKLKDRMNEYPSTSIIINSTNEVLVDQFLNKNITYNDIIKGIKYKFLGTYYKKYAIKKPRTINQILKHRLWAKKTLF